MSAVYAIGISYQIGYEIPHRSKPHRSRESGPSHSRPYLPHELSASRSRQYLPRETSPSRSKPSRSKPRRSKPRRSKPQYDNFYTPQNEAFYSQFHYPPLDRRHNEIRLLRIDTSGRGDHRMIPKVPLDRTSSYSALSYYSGSATNTRPILVDGIPFNAFANTADALDEAIRCWNALFPGQALIMWTDQICINQSDPAEKSHQVAFMQQIYRQADRVFLSMMVTRDVRPAFKWLKKLVHESASVDDKASSEQYQNGQVNSMIYAPNSQLSTEDPEPVLRSVPTHTWDLMYDILEHPWWSRAWVYQEFITASRTIFLFSNDTYVDWDELHPMLTCFLSLSFDKHLAACSGYRNCAITLARRQKQYETWSEEMSEPCQNCLLDTSQFCEGACFPIYELWDRVKQKKHVDPSLTQKQRSEARASDEWKNCVIACCSSPVILLLGIAWTAVGCCVVQSRSEQLQLLDWSAIETSMM
jgi:hypothetical protein